MQLSTEMLRSAASLGRVQILYFWIILGCLEQKLELKAAFCDPFTQHGRLYRLLVSPGSWHRPLLGIFVVFLLLFSYHTPRKYR